jgi:hypothetical protein
MQRTSCRRQPLSCARVRTHPRTHRHTHTHTWRYFLTRTVLLQPSTHTHTHTRAHARARAHTHVCARALRRLYSGRCAGDAAARRRARVIRNKEGILRRVSTATATATARKSSRSAAAFATRMYGYASGGCRGTVRVYRPSPGRTQCAVRVRRAVGARESTVSVLRAVLVGLRTRGY